MSTVTVTVSSGARVERAGITLRVRMTGASAVHLLIQPDAQETLMTLRNLVASVYDLFLANYGVDQGFGGAHMPTSYDDVEPYSPAWAEAIITWFSAITVTVAPEIASRPTCP